jgi:hypothetical protein
VARTGDLAVIGRRVRATSDPQAALDGADLVLVALPAYAHGSALRTIAPHVSKQAWVGASPATGLFHDRARRILGRETRIFGLREAPYNCRVVEHGSTIDVMGVVPEIAVVAGDPTESHQIADRLAELLGLPCRTLRHPLSISIRPLNIAFHPSRLRSLFGDWNGTQLYPQRRSFYEEWDDEASRLYIQCSDELVRLAKAISLFDPVEIDPVPQRYGTRSPAQLTRRIRDLAGLRGIDAPMKPAAGGFVPDVASRFFREDIGVGLALAQRLARAYRVDVPTIAAIVAWGRALTRSLHTTKVCLPLRSDRVAGSLTDAARRWLASFP